MKRRYESHQKINTKSNKRYVSDPCPGNTRNGIVPDATPNLDCCKKHLQAQTESAKSSLLEDSSALQSRISTKLRSLLDGLDSNLQSISGEPPSSEAEESTLQNFIHSAKSQISELLRRQQKPGGASKEKTSPKTDPKPVDPLQIQISLKLQDLLCKALDDRQCKNEPNGNSVEEQDLQDLSHLLHDFLSSAKKKILNSLTREKATSRAKALKCDSGKVSCSTQRYQKIENKVPKSTVSPPRMDDSDSCGSSGGILLLGEAEKAPDYLDLSMEVGEDSDVDDPGFKNDDTDSDEEVVVLGEKRPTYQEITIDEEDSGDEGEVFEEEQVVRTRKRIPRDLEDLLYDCPKCEKKFRVESLLKFHVRMHSVVESHPHRALPTEEEVADASAAAIETSPIKAKSRKEKENKLNSKSLHQHKIQKHSRRKVKLTS